MAGTDLAAGAASVSIHQIGADHCAKQGLCFSPPRWPQRLRCLVLSQADTLIVLFQADWGSWPKLVPEARQIVADAAPGREADVLCFASQANHNIDYDGPHWGAIDPKDKRHDPHLRAGILGALSGVFREAFNALRPAQITLGQGCCDSLAVNFYYGRGAADPAVNVLRIAGGGALIAVLVNFACRAFDTHLHLDGGFPAAMEKVVQAVYGPVPVLYLNGGAGDQCLTILADPLDSVGDGMRAHKEAHGALLLREYDRAGRVLGGEVCKVLAQTEVAGQRLQTINERWRYTRWAVPSKGLCVSDPFLKVRTVPVSLWHKPLPPVEECEAKVAALEAQMKPFLKALPTGPKGYAPFLLSAEDTRSDLYRLMELGAARKYWAGVAGRAKRQARCGRGRTHDGEVKIIVLNADIAAVCVPGSLCRRVALAIREQSPYPATLVWDCLGPSSLRILIPEAEGAMGGTHSGDLGLAQEAIEQMVDAVTQNLRAIRHDVLLRAGSSSSRR
jgi:hypothetical protein